MRRVLVARRCCVTVENWSQLSRDGCMSTRQMRRVVMSQRSNQCDFVGVLREFRKMLANLHSRYSRRNRLKRSADFGGCVWFQIKGVELAWPAPHEHKDTCFGRLRSYTRCDRGLGEALCYSYPKTADRGCLQETTAILQDGRGKRPVTKGWHRKDFSGGIANGNRSNNRDGGALILPQGQHQVIGKVATRADSRWLAITRCLTFFGFDSNLKRESVSDHVHIGLRGVAEASPDVIAPSY